MATTKHSAYTHGQVALPYQGVHPNKIALVSDLECFSVTLAKTGQSSQEPKNERSKLERRGGGASNPTVIGHHRRFQGLGFWPLFVAWLACRHCLLGSGARSLLGDERPICGPYGPASCLVLTLLRLLSEVLDGGGINSRRRISPELMVSTRVLRVRYEGQVCMQKGGEDAHTASRLLGCFDFLKT